MTPVVLPLAELEALAARYRQDRDGRRAAPRTAEARDWLDRATRTLRAAADAIGDLGRHEHAVVGINPDRACALREDIEDMAARCGGGTLSIARFNATGRRRLVDYIRAPAKFDLVRSIADHLDKMGVPLGSKDIGSLWDCAHECLYLAGEDEPSRGLSNVVADVISARKNRASGGEVRELLVAAE